MSCNDIPCAWVAETATPLTKCALKSPKQPVGAEGDQTSYVFWGPAIHRTGITPVCMVPFDSFGEALVLSGYSLMGSSLSKHIGYHLLTLYHV